MSASTDQPRPALALDVGGTKLAAALVDPAGELVGERHVVPTPQHADAETLWAAVQRLLDGVCEAAGSPPVAGVGVGCGGPMQWPAGLVSPINIPGWRDFPLRDRLAERYAGTSVRLHNDAVCLAVAEHWRGAGAGAANLLGMVVSTGVGGGLVLGGRLIDGATGNAGHVGHTVVDPEGPPCACGGRGCLEAIARGPALVAWAREHGWDARADAGGAALADAARAGDEVARLAFERAGRALGIAIASAAHLLDLDVVAVGGGVTQAGELLFTPLERTLATYAVLPFARAVRVVPAVLGQTAGVIGAAALVHRGEAYWSPRDELG